MPSDRWFQQLFGFREASYAGTRCMFAVEGPMLRSLANGRSFAIGTFSTPTLAWLRDRTQGLRTQKASDHGGAASDSLRPGRLRVTHEVIGDVLELHAR